MTAPAAPSSLHVLSECLRKDVTDVLPTESLLKDIVYVAVVEVHSATLARLLPEPIIVRPLLLIGQTRIRTIQLLESVQSTRRLVLVRMYFDRQLKTHG